MLLQQPFLRLQQPPFPTPSQEGPWQAIQRTGSDGRRQLGHQQVYTLHMKSSVVLKMKPFLVSMPYCFVIV